MSVCGVTIMMAGGALKKRQVQKEVSADLSE